MRNWQGQRSSAWAFVKSDQVEELLFAALVRTVKQRMGEFNARALANTAWAFANSDQA